MAIYFLGIDLGTTGTKIILMREDGRVVDKNYVEYEILSPKADYAEQNPLEWWEGLSKISKEMLARNQDKLDKIAGLGIAGQMHTQVYLDKNHKVLRNAITWMDQRSKDIVEKINADAELKDRIFKATSNSLTTTYTAPNVKWVQENQKDIYRKTKHILLAKDFIKFLLSGQMITDYSDAAGTMLFNVAEQKWSGEMFDLFKIDRSLFPPADKSAKVIGKVTAEAAEKTGIPEGTPVINGCADQAATSLGAGMVTKGQVTAIIGTAGVVSVLSNKAAADPDNRVLCWNYCLEDKWINLGIMQTAGESLKWFKNAFDKDSVKVYQNYNQEAEKISAGSEGLIFLPYLMGERTPYWDSDARGVFFGLNLKHQKYHFVRSIMEGVSFAFKNNLEAVESLGVKVDNLRLLGGGAKSKVWKEILSQILNRKISTVEVEETAALGSSILCGLALGIYQSPEAAVEKLVKIREEYYSQVMPVVYQKNYKIFKELYPSLKELYKKLNQ
ncbi:MAG: xylulokinase [bacterium]